MFSILDQGPLYSKAIQRNTDGEFRAFSIQHTDDIVVDKGALHARVNQAKQKIASISCIQAMMKANPSSTHVLPN